MTTRSIFLFFLFAFIQGHSQNIYTFAGTGQFGYSGDGGPANTAKVGNISQIASDKAGNIYFVDNDCVRKVNTAGIISTIAGMQTWGYSGDGGPATSAQFYHPDGICIDTSGNIYIADWGNSRIRKINTAGIISTIAGNGTSGCSGDGGPAISAQVIPSGIAVDAAGNIYFTDESNNRVRKINTSGIITTVAGTSVAGFSGDGGPSASAQVNDPYGITADASGNVYFSDMLNYRIRKISTGGIISTIGGTGTSGETGDGGPATAAQLSALNLALDASGNLYLINGTDIRKINTAGIISRFAGNGTGGYTGDGGPATSAQLALPHGIASDPYNNIYVSQQGIGPMNQAVRVVCQSGCFAGVNENHLNKDDLKLYPQPAGDAVTLELQTATGAEPDHLVICDQLGRTVKEEVISFYQNKVLLKLDGLNEGVYSLSLISGKTQTVSKRFVIAR